MKNASFESTLQKILKKILLIIIGSGLITNALYIYGLAYYEGYIENLGFEYNFFPVKWDDTLLWTYFASRELGASTVTFWAKLTGPVIFLILLVSYFIARLWMAINASEGKRNNIIKKNTLLARFLVNRRKKHPKLFRFIYPTIKWLLIMEQSIWAFLASYFVLIFIFFIPLFIFIWVYFPLIGLNHGKSIGAKRFEYYQEKLCVNEKDYWMQCVKLTTEHLQQDNLPKMVYGRVIVKNGSLIGLITENGPITMTMPTTFFHKTKKNECYEVGCSTKEKPQKQTLESEDKS